MKELTESTLHQDAPNLWDKLLEVAAACSYVQKGGTNLFHKYNYATAADVLAKVSHALYENKLVSWTESWINEATTRQNAKGGTENLVTAGVRLHVVDPPTGQEVVAQAFGSGQDNGDKAVMKAQTAALKYAWMMLLNISTGDDPEADDSVDRRITGEKREKPPARGPKTGDFTAADKELARQAEADGASLPEPPIEAQLERIEREAKAKFGTPEVCKKCGSALGDYTSREGRVYQQCVKAHSDWDAGRKMGIVGTSLKEITKGHTYRMRESAPA